MTTPISLSDPDASFGDDSSFVAGLLASDAGTGTDTLAHGPVIGDSGTGADSSLSVTVAASLTEAGAGDDLPWEYISQGLPIFPYYADLPQDALQRVRVGDKFQWYAGG